MKRREFVLSIEIENDAFGDPAPEIARILRELADRVESHHALPLRLRDVNGNTVGYAKVVRREG